MLDFETLYRTHQDRVRIRIRTLLSRTHPDLVDDAIQETWIKIWRGLPKLSNETNIPGWVFLIATNCVRDMMRKRHSYSLELFIERSGADEDTLNLPTFQEADPYSYVPERVERQGRYQMVWEKTSQKHKAVFMQYLTDTVEDEKVLYEAKRYFKIRMKRLQRRERRAS